MTDLKFKPLDDLSYEDALQELEELVQTLEAGEKDLQTTLQYFERGQQLASLCISLLDEADSKVAQLMKGDDDSA